MTDDPRITQARERHTNFGLPAQLGGRKETWCSHCGDGWPCDFIIAADHLAEREREIARLIKQWRQRGNTTLNPVSKTLHDCADQLEALSLSEREKKE